MTGINLILGPACCVWCRKQHEIRIASTNVFGRKIGAFVYHAMCEDSLTGADYSDLPYSNTEHRNRSDMIDNARFALRQLTNEERISAIDRFCHDCGRLYTDDKDRCHCENDD